MPYKFQTDKIPLPEGKDRRVKLEEAQREVIRINSEGKSQRALARDFGVSRRLVGFIQNPESQKRNLERRAERGGWSQYYIKDKNTATIREHRQYKQEVLSNGDT